MNYCTPTSATTADVYSFRQLRADNPNVSFPSIWFEEASYPAVGLEDFNMFPFTIAVEPPYDPLLERIELGSIIDVAGEWVKEWLVIALTPEEIAENYRQAEMSAIINAVEFQAFINLSPSAVEAQVDATYAAGPERDLLRQVLRLQWLISQSYKV